MMNESADDCSDEFHYQSDFTQFLKEARNSAFQVNLNETKQLDWDKKHRKSWKKSLFSWLKNESKSKPLKQPSKARRAHVSGPVRLTVGGGGRARQAASGPLSRRPEEREVPYMCLGELNKHKIQAYGPLYLVT